MYYELYNIFLFGAVGASGKQFENTSRFFGLFLWNDWVVSSTDLDWSESRKSNGLDIPLQKICWDFLVSYFSCQLCGEFPNNISQSHNLYILPNFLLEIQHANWAYAPALRLRCVGAIHRCWNSSCSSWSSPRKGNTKLICLHIKSLWTSMNPWNMISKSPYLFSSVRQQYKCPYRWYSPRECRRYHHFEGRMG